MTDDDITKLREALKACMFYPSGRVSYPVPDWENCANPPRIARLLDALDEARRDAERWRFAMDPAHDLYPFWQKLINAGVPLEEANRIVDAAMKEPTK